MRLCLKLQTLPYGFRVTRYNVIVHADLPYLGEGEQHMLAAKFVLAAAIVNLIVLFAALAVNVSLASFG